MDNEVIEKFECEATAAMEQLTQAVRGLSAECRRPESPEHQFVEEMASVAEDLGSTSAGHAACECLGWGEDGWKTGEQFVIACAHGVHLYAVRIRRDNQDNQEKALIVSIDNREHVSPSYKGRRQIITELADCEWEVLKSRLAHLFEEAIPDD